MTARRFHLERRQDITGISGTGLVAEGIHFSDGTTVVRWLKAGTARPAHVKPTTVVHDDIESVIGLHGHDGATQVTWLDEPERQPVPLETGQQFALLTQVRGSRVPIMTDATTKRTVHTLKITNGTGDNVAVWAEGETLTDAEVDFRFDEIITADAAPARFAAEKAKGSLAFSVPAGRPIDTADGDVIHEFDPDAEQIVMIPQIVGG